MRRLTLSFLIMIPLILASFVAINYFTAPVVDRVEEDSATGTVQHWIELRGPGHLPFVGSRENEPRLFLMCQSEADGSFRRNAFVLNDGDAVVWWTEGDDESGSITFRIDEGPLTEGPLDALWMEKSISSMLNGSELHYRFKAENAVRSRTYTASLSALREVLNRTDCPPL